MKSRSVIEVEKELEKRGVIDSRATLSVNKEKSLICGIHGKWEDTLQHILLYEVEDRKSFFSQTINLEDLGMLKELKVSEFLNKPGIHITEHRIYEYPPRKEEDSFFSRLGILPKLFFSKKFDKEASKI